MNTRGGEPIVPGDHSEAGARVLHVVGGYAGFHLVSPETIAAAEAAQAEADVAPYYEDFGDLRRSGDLELLSDKLGDWGLSIEDYLGAIERSANRSPSSDDVSERLAAVDDINFAGDDDANAPADTSDFRAHHERENEVEDHYTYTIETRMGDDVPRDILAAFDAIHSSMFTDYENVFVDPERLDAMISALEARGFTVIRD